MRRVRHSIGSLLFDKGLKNHILPKWRDQLLSGRCFRRKFLLRACAASGVECCDLSHVYARVR
jgi:hypothetical protein